MSADPHNPVYDHDTSRHNNAPMIHAFLLFPCIQFFMFHICMLFPPSLRLTWLADPALVTSIYPNRTQYMPCVLQEAFLLDGVNAGVRGNGRRFSKTSSYPPCRCYAFILFYPYFLTTSSSPFIPADSLILTTHFTPLHLINHSHTPYSLCSLHSSINGNTFYLRRNNVAKDSSWPLSCLVYITVDTPVKVLSFVILGIPLPYYASVF